jgi:adenylyltransferase/sulfurtransferase
VEARVPNSSSPGARARHARQARFVGIGAEGQEKIARSRATIVGLGALGSVIAETLARAGVGSLGLIDRDTVEETNLQRQVLYDEEDAREALPKAEAARRAIARIDSGLRLEAHVEDLTSRNADRLLSGSDVILDGTDNFATRYLINDFAVERKIPWVYGAAVSSSGLVLAVIPNETACLRCAFPEPSPPEETQTCETAGIIAPASGMVALAQAAEALKILCGARESLLSGMLQIDPWAGSYRVFRAPRDPNCPCCVRGERPWLRGAREDLSAVLCGRGSVQVSPPAEAEGPRRIDLALFAARLPGVERHNSFSLRFVAEGHPITLFPDGRAIVGNTTDPSVARALYARYIGS